MSDIATTSDQPASPDTPAATPPVPPRRNPGHRGQDVRDTVAELAARAHEISLEAGSKMSSALKDVISAAAGVTAFAIESARDLVQYMVRRGQMTQDEADKLIRSAEEASSKRSKAAAAKAVPARKAVATQKSPAAAKASPAVSVKATPVARHSAAAKAAPKVKAAPIPKAMARKAPSRKPAAKK